jgi:hypothetical protein
MQIYKYVQRWIQVLWDLKLIQFLGPSLFKKKTNKQIMNAKLGTKMNIYVGPLLGPWKWPMQVRSP